MKYKKPQEYHHIGKIPSEVTKLDPAIYNAHQFGDVSYKGHKYKPVLAWKEIKD